MSSPKKLLSIFALLLFSMAVLRAQDITVDYTDVKLKTVLADLRSKSGCNFVYNNSLVDVDALVTASASGTLRHILDLVLSELPVAYEIVDKQVILRPKTAEKQPVNKVTVSGVVLDDAGLPLPGVFVSESGTTNATSTDGSGRYTINVTPGAVLSFSSLGLQTVEQASPKAGGKVDVTLTSDVNYLESVVVVGYGVQKRANLTGAVSSINFSEGMDSRPITSTSTALGGLAPGLAVSQTSGRPGEDGASLRIRGNTTLNSNSPLVLVDGIEYSMDNVNPQDIESITVLKDASSTAIYGSRAANGVILITTKGGTSGKMHITYTCNLNAQLPSLGGLGYVTDYAQTMRLNNEGADNIGIAHPYSDLTINLWENAKKNPNGMNTFGVKNSIAYPNTDWFDELFNPGFMQTHNISMSGGTEKVKSYVSMGFMDNPGVMSHHGLDSGTSRIDIRANVELNLAKWLDSGVRIFAERQDYGMSDVGSAFSYLKMTVPGMYPGSANKWGYIATDEENPNANNLFKNMAQRGGKKYNYRLYATAYLKAKLYKGLSFELTANHNVNLGYENKYTLSANIWNYVTDKIQSETSLQTASNTISTSNSYRTNVDAILRYNETFGRHEVGAIAGYSLNHYRSPFSSVSKYGKTDWAITEMSAYINYDSCDSGNSEWALMSWFGRVNYAFDERFLFEANLRADGSSRFAPESRWGIFPSFSAGWRISQEKWMSGARSWMDNLKIRASWGITGNNNSGNYAWQSTFSSVDVVSGGVESSGLIVTALGNSNLVWETTRTSDVGLDFAFLKNRLTGEIDGYVRNTTGILFRPSIYMTMGAVTAPYENLAAVQNKGLELGLKWRDGVGSDFSYSIGLNLAYNMTLVKKYKGELIQRWMTDEDDNRIYVNNIGDVAQSGFGGYIVEGHILGDQYIYKLYNGSGAGYSGSGEVDVNAGPKDGMIRTESDLNWVKAMIAAGYKFNGGQPVSKNTMYYGDFLYADIDGDGDYGDNDDRYFTGHSNTPKLTSGLNISLKYKGFDFYALFTGAFGFYLNWNTSTYNTTLVNRGQAISRRIADDHYFYNPEGDPSLNNINATYPRLCYNKTLNDDISDFYHYRGDYVKLKNIQLGYTFPSKWMDKIHVQSFRLFVSAENVFTLTKYPGLDPEIGTSIGYPLMRSICGGLQITL